MPACLRLEPSAAKWGCKVMKDLRLGPREPGQNITEADQEELASRASYCSLFAAVRPFLGGMAAWRHKTDLSQHAVGGGVIVTAMM